MTARQRKDRIESTASCATLVRGGAALTRANLRGCDRVYEVYSGSDLWGTDCEYYVAQFDDEYWVVPEETPGSREWLFDHWWLAISQRGLGRQALIEQMPRAWRRRRLFVLKLPQPVLGNHPIDTLPAWDKVSPLDWSKHPRRMTCDATSP